MSDSTDWNAFAKDSISDKELVSAGKVLGAIIGAAGETKEEKRQLMDEMIENLQTARANFTRNTSGIINQLIKEDTNANS